MREEEEEEEEEEDLLFRVRTNMLREIARGRCVPSVAVQKVCAAACTPCNCNGQLRQNRARLLPSAPA